MFSIKVATASKVPLAVFSWAIDALVRSFATRQFTETEKLLPEDKKSNEILAEESVRAYT